MSDQGYDIWKVDVTPVTPETATAAVRVDVPVIMVDGPIAPPKPVSLSPTSG